MANDNFWSIAARDPQRPAIIEPDRREISAGDLLASVNQVVHALRGLGLERGDSIAAALPNSLEAFELYLAVQQAGWYLTPINFHLVGPEIAYILHDCEAKVLIAHESFSQVCAAALEELGSSGLRAFAVGEIPGFGSYAELKRNRPTTLPENRSLGLIMNYTSGTTGGRRVSAAGCRKADPKTASCAAAFWAITFALKKRTTSTCWRVRGTTPRQWSWPVPPCTWVIHWSSWTALMRSGACSSSNDSG